MGKTLFLLALMGAPLTAFAQSSDPQSGISEATERARVISIDKTEVQNVAGTDISTEYQTFTAIILTGPDVGETVTIEDDHLGLRTGDEIFLLHTIDVAEARDSYTVLDRNRLGALAVLFAIFVVAIVVVGGWTGIRGLIALAISIFIVLYALLPALSAGYNPFLTSLVVAGLIVVFGSYITHGVNRTTTAAVLGLLVTVAVTALVAHVAISATHLSGLVDDHAVSLHFATRGAIDFVGLLLGAVIIGALGILYDAAIGQAVAVEELLRAAPTMSRQTVFARAMRIGREHIGALVNTLVIAYVGAALPLLLLFQSFSTESILATLNREEFATEVVRAIVGTLGIILTVPISTFVAILLLSHLPARREI